MKLFHAFLSLAIFAAATHGQIRIGGSDLLEPGFSAALTEHAELNEIEIAADFTGSYPALADLQKGEIDVAIVAIPTGSPMPDESAFRAVNIASKVLAIAVPTGNPLNQITMNQLWSIFGDAEGMTRWGELGLTGEWSTRSIVLRSVSRAEHTLAVDLFRHTVLETGNLRRTVAESPDVESIRLAFQQEETAIALLDQIPADEQGMKILPIARRQTDFAHGPTPEAVANDEYPLRLPIYLVFPNSEGAQVKDLLRFSVSDEATRALEASGLTPLPRQQRQRLSLEFEQL